MAAVVRPELTPDVRTPRLTILDDNPFVRRADGAIVPVAATFHRFAEAVVAAGGLDPAAYLVPVRDLPEDERPPDHRAVDPSLLRVVPTAPFDGIAGYARRALRLVRHNWPLIREAVDEADVVWIKAPASNAPLVALACRRAGVARFTWVAGSVRSVVRSRPGSRAQRALAGTAAVGYDSVTRWLERTGPSIRLSADLFTSVVTSAEVEATRVRMRRAEVGREGPSRHASDPFRVAWAGRVAPEKGLADLLAAVAILRRGGLDVRLDLVGDGPARASIEGIVASLELTETVRWHGYVADRETYLGILRDAELFVLPSHAEGLPKVVVEAMAAGLPVVASRIGAVPELLDHGSRGRLVGPEDPSGLADAIAGLAADPTERTRLAEVGLAWAAEHTMEAQAGRLVDWLRTTFPELDWPVVDGSDGAAR